MQPAHICGSLRSTGKVIGQIYLAQSEPTEHLTCELGCVLHPAYRAGATAPKPRPP